MVGGERGYANRIRILLGQEEGILDGIEGAVQRGGAIREGIEATLVYMEKEIEREREEWGDRERVMFEDMAKLQATIDQLHQQRGERDPDARESKLLHARFGADDAGRLKVEQAIQPLHDYFVERQTIERTVREGVDQTWIETYLNATPDGTIEGAMDALAGNVLVREAHEMVALMAEGRECVQGMRYFGYVGQRGDWGVGLARLQGLLVRMNELEGKMSKRGWRDGA